MRHKASYFASIFLLLISELAAFQRSALFDAKENKKLAGSVLRARRSSDSLTCAHWCLSEPLCASFNYQVSSGQRGLCELNQASQNDEERLRREPGWLHGGLKSRTQKKKKKPKGPCKTWRTTDNDCCVFPFTYRGKSRHSCVYDGVLWCATTDNYDVDQQKGICQEYNFTFTTLGANGAIGPSDTSGYQGTTLEGKVQLEGSGIQIWTVPIDGNFSIEVKGASGGIGIKTANANSWRTGGRGARIQGEFYFSMGTELKILVGQVGKTGTVGSPLPGGGGGGSFVTRRDNMPLIIAGGGGGGGPPGDGYSGGDPGQVGRNGSQNGGGGGGGGEVVEEMAPSALLEAGAGGGIRGNGKGGRNTNGGKSFKHGGEGGSGTMSGGDGGFGGGGAAGHFPGGGGGYSGGGVTKSSISTTAGGGGSFNEGSSPVQTAGENLGDGSVRIKLLKPQGSP